MLPRKAKLCTDPTVIPGIFLASKFVEAKRMFEQQRVVFLDLHETLPKAHIERWETMSLEPVKGANGKWTSPMMDHIADGPLYIACLLNSLKITVHKLQV